MRSFQIREIQEKDNLAVAQIIREVMTEFDCVGDGYSINDPEVDNMFDAYNNPRSVFYVIEDENNKKLLGCGGIAPLKNGDKHICELQKMYFKKSLRGHGMGQRLLDVCLGAAKEMSFSICYLETTFRMKAANKIYQKNGFRLIKNSLGCTGHSGCDTFYTKTLTSNTPFSALIK